MPRSTSALPALLPLALLAALLPACRPAETPAGPARLELAAGPGGPAWYRGNLHTHTLWSDGDDYPEQVAGWYRDHGYQFLVLSEHDLVPTGDRWIDAQSHRGRAEATRKLEAAAAPGAIDSREADGRRQLRLKRFDELSAALSVPGKFLLLQGEEISALHEGASIHLNAVNLPRAIEPLDGADVVEVIERNTAAALAQSPGADAPVLVQVNHPNFIYSLTAEQLARVRSLEFMEVFNGHPISTDPGDHHHVPVEKLWDIVLTHRIAHLGLPLVYGVANDDSHHYHGPSGDGASPGRGWNMVLAPSLDAPALIGAMRRGHFYASSGVRLAAIRQWDDALRVDVETEPGLDYRIEFIGTRRGFDPASREVRSSTGDPVYATRRYSDDIGAVLASVDGPAATYAFDPDDLYVRVRVSSSRKHPNPSRPLEFEQAWTQPVPGPAAQGLVPDPSGLPESADVALHRQLGARFRPLPTDAGARLLAQTTPDCSLDRTSGRDGRDGARLARARGVLFGGWIADRRRATAPDSLSVLLRGAGDYIADGSNGAARADVAAALGKADFERAGFNLGADLDAVAPGDYRVHLVAHYGDGSTACDTGKSLQVE
jgi:hypothetical protein